MTRHSFTFEFVKSRLLQEEKRADLRESTGRLRSEYSALVNSNESSGSRYANMRYKCTECRRNGHTADRCWEKDINGRRPTPPNGYRRKKPTRPANAFVGNIGGVGSSRNGNVSSSVESELNFEGQVGKREETTREEGRQRMKTEGKGGQVSQRNVDNHFKCF